MSNPQKPLIKIYLKNLLRSLEQGDAHCKRIDGTLRAWFHTRAEAEAFEADPANVSYHGDVAHLCQHCGYWHLSRPEWLVAERWTN